MQENVITSLTNSRVKRLVLLQQKSAERLREGVFVVEGVRELERCSDAGLEITEVYYCPAIYPQVPAVECGALYEVTQPVYEKIAYRGGTEGVMGIVKTRHLSLDDLQLGEAPLVVVLESVEKPGNLGAVLRSADAAGVDAVIVCDPLTDLYNPNLVRSSTGAIFSVPCVACTSEECIAFLKQRGIAILTAQLQDSELYYDTDMKRATAIVMGTEATGLTNVWREAADAHIRIPMLGIVDSLNVSVSAAILMYEAVKQRQ
ncbi:MAG: RNA methyltransferase [Bacteroidales bacterium]|nr:RNA methyltransferase [Candidatus Sodaliphilus fimicaballi]